MKKRLYIGCGLTHAPKEFAEDVERLKTELRWRGFEVFDFVGLVGGTSEDVYRYDIHKCTKRCDMFAGICDFPSIGLGYELCFAVEKRGIPVLATAHMNAKVTRLVLGISAPNFEFRRYQNMMEVADMIEAMAPSWWRVVMRRAANLLDWMSFSKLKFAS